MQFHHVRVTRPRVSGWLGASFLELGIPEDLADGVESMGIMNPSPIQEASLPHLLEGRHGLLHAETGSGKTLAFLLPALTKVDFFRAAPQLLVMAPTRELVVQIAAEALRILGIEAEDAPATAALLVGRGDFTDMSFAELEVPLVFATGTEALRALERMNQPQLKIFLDDLKVLVLDEVDRLLKPPSRHAPMSQKGKVSGVKTAVQEVTGRDGKIHKHEEPAAIVLKTLSNGRVAFKVAGELQIIGASATIGRTLRRALPSLLQIDVDDLPVLRAGQDSADKSSNHVRARSSRLVVMPDSLEHYIFVLDDGSRSREKPKLDSLLETVQLITEDTRFKGDRCLLMLPPGASVKNSVRRLRKLGSFAVALHEEMGFRSGVDGEEASVGALVGSYVDLKQSSAGDDDSSGSEGKGRFGGAHFKAGTRIIVTRQDVVRGIHLDEVPLVVIFDQPRSVDDYYHIAGRTGRQGSRGKVVTLCNYWDAKGMLSWQAMMGARFEVLNSDKSEV